MSSRTGDMAGDEGDQDVKLLLAIASLAGSVSLLITDWAGAAVPYL